MKYYLMITIDLLHNKISEFDKIRKFLLEHKIVSKLGNDLQLPEGTYLGQICGENDEIVLKKLEQDLKSFYLESEIDVNTTIIMLSKDPQFSIF